MYSTSTVASSSANGPQTPPAVYRTTKLSRNISSNGISDGLLRRRLRVELSRLDEQINSFVWPARENNRPFPSLVPPRIRPISIQAAAGKTLPYKLPPNTDPMTLHIALWKNSFVRALNCYRNEERIRSEFFLLIRQMELAPATFEAFDFDDEKGIRDAYIQLLQEKLRDPATHAPLDFNSVLDRRHGQVYGSLSLEVFARFMPEEFRNRSPMRLNDPTPMQTRPHYAVREALKWLQSHDALLFSQVLEETFVRQMMDDPYRDIDEEDAIASILATQAERDKKEAEELTSRTGALRQQMAKISYQLTQEFRELTAMVSRTGQPLAEVQGEIQAAQAREVTESRRTNQRLDALSERILAFAEEVNARIKAGEEVDRQIMLKFEQLRSELHAKNTEMRKRTEVLKDDLKSVTRQMDTVAVNVEKVGQAIAKFEEEQDDDDTWFVIARNVLVSTFCTLVVYSTLGPAGMAVINGTGAETTLTLKVVF